MSRGIEFRPTPNDPLHQLHYLNKAGAQIFDYRLFPKNYVHPEFLFEPAKANAVKGFFRTVQDGLRYTTRKDDPNYPAYIHDGKYVHDALQQRRDYNILLDDIDRLLEETLNDPDREKTTPFVSDSEEKQYPEVEAMIASELPTPTESETEALPPDVLPSTQHALITLGILNKLPPDQLPYVGQFPWIARNMWGPALTVDRVRILIESMQDAVDKSFQPYGRVTNYDLVPVAQFFDIGSRLTSGVFRQLYYKGNYKPY